MNAVKTAQCTCGATVAGTGWGVTADGEEIARCAVCGTMVVIK